ncbi:MAG: chemotaxis protein CheX [Anaerolineaceae bacterium]|nr:chemotaxis protein CheX [Anaerolineaceae bacterium]
MNVKLLNPFVDSAYEVIKTETRGNIQRGDLRLENGVFVTEDVTVILSLVGAVDGTVFYSMTADTATKLASVMMADELKDFGTLAQSGIAELGNVITGRASMKLSEAGYECTISTPSLIIGKGAMISTLDYPRLVVPLVTVAGTVLIHLALRQSNAQGLKTPQMAIPKPYELPVEEIKDKTG